MSHSSVQRTAHLQLISPLSVTSHRSKSRKLRWMECSELLGIEDCYSYTLSWLLEPLAVDTRHRHLSSGRWNELPKAVKLSKRRHVRWTRSVTLLTPTCFLVSEIFLLLWILSVPVLEVYSKVMTQSSMLCSLCWNLCDSSTQACGTCSESEHAHWRFFKVSLQTLTSLTSLRCGQATAKGFVLIQTKEVSMRPEDVKRVFQRDADDLTEWITKGKLAPSSLISWSGALAYWPEGVCQSVSVWYL